MSSEYLFSVISDGETSIQFYGNTLVKCLHAWDISTESLGSESCCEDADEDVEPAAHLETKCVTVALDSCRDNLVKGVLLL